MFACICNAVTEDQVNAAIDLGATSVAAISDLTGASTCCGTCHDHIEDLIDERCRACPLAGSRAA